MAVQGEEALRFLMVALSIDVLCELLMQWFISVKIVQEPLHPSVDHISATVMLKETEVYLALS